MRFDSLLRLLWRIARPSRYTEEISGWLDFLPIGGGGAGVIAALVLGVSPLGAAVIGLSVLLLLTFGAAFTLQVQSDVRGEKRPRLVFGQPIVRKVWIGPVESVHSAAAVNTAIEVGALTNVPDLHLRDTISFKGEPSIGITHVVNDPKDGPPEAQANHVVINLTFFAADGIKAVNLYGRWTENEQPGTRPHLMPIDDIRRRDLIPNGEPNHIDVVMKYDEDDCCYAFNDETCRSSPDWRDPIHRLPDSEYHVRLVLKGVGMEPTEEWLLLKNPGKGKRMKLERTTPLALEEEDSQA